MKKLFTILCLFISVSSFGQHLAGRSFVSVRGSGYTSTNDRHLQAVLAGGRFTQNLWYWSVGAYAQNDHNKFRPEFSYWTFGPDIQVGKFVPITKRFGWMPQLGVQGAVFFANYTGFKSQLQFTPLRVGYQAGHRLLLSGHVGQASFMYRTYNRVADTELKPFTPSAGVGLWYLFGK